MNKLIVLLLIAALGVSCNEAMPKEDETELVPVTEAITIDTSFNQDYVAEIQAVKNVEIRAKVNGYLEALSIDEGQYVQQGQIMFRINPGGYKQDLAISKAAYRSAKASEGSVKIELDNVKLLHRKNLVSITELSIAENKLASAKARTEEALANEERSDFMLSNTVIRAPFSGFVNRIPHKIGSLLEEGTLLTSLSETREVFAYFDVSEKEYLAYAENALSDSTRSKKVTLVLANGSLHPVEGKIETVEGEIEASTGNIAFRARFGNPNKILKHGASGKVRMQRMLHHALIIPQKATFEIQDKIYVYVVNKEGVLETRNIVTRHRLSHLYVIESGLKEGERIVYEGLQNVSDGAHIKSRFVPMNQIIRTLSGK